LHPLDSVKTGRPVCDGAWIEVVRHSVASTWNGDVRADVGVGKSVRFSATVEAPPNTGKVMTAEWDFEGAGTFATIAKFTSGTRVTLKSTHAFARPGTYFVTLRVASQRDGDAKSPFARILNLDRMRVVVK